MSNVTSCSPKMMSPRSTHTSGATGARVPSIQLVFLRASGLTLDDVGTLPRQLLRYVGERLDLPIPTIASLRTLYRRYKTQYVHQIWACEYLGLRSIETGHWAELEAWMRRDATESITLDELFQHAHYWLYERRILIPSERTLRDLGRSIWSDIERDVLAMIEATVTETQLIRADAVLATQEETSGMSVLEWLKAPPARHSPSTLTETLAKVRFLKELGAHEWAVDSVPFEKQRAYAQRIQARRPAKVRELKASTRTIELICFLRVTLAVIYPQECRLEFEVSPPQARDVGEGRPCRTVVLSCGETVGRLPVQDSSITCKFRH